MSLNIGAALNRGSGLRRFNATFPPDIKGKNVTLYCGTEGGRGRIRPKPAHAVAVGRSRDSSRLISVPGGKIISHNQSAETSAAAAAAAEAPTALLAYIHLAYQRINNSPLSFYLSFYLSICAAAFDPSPTHANVPLLPRSSFLQSVIGASLPRCQRDDSLPNLDLCRLRSEWRFPTPIQVFILLLLRPIRFLSLFA